jgi:predicted lipoprotein with Yx(FWY)xxD motif
MPDDSFDWYSTKYGKGKNMNKSLIVPTILLAISLIFITSCSPSLIPITGLQAQSTAVATAEGNPSVTVHDKEYDGTNVTVEEAFSQGPGWMVIHNQVNGGVGEAIGETHIDNGDNKNIVVKIDPNKATPVMYAMLHKDAGVVGKYEYPGPDEPVYDASGAMITPAFKATVGQNGSNATSSLTVKDQTVTGGRVTIDIVVSNGPGWVTVNIQDADGKPGAEIGYTAVKSGSSSNVVITIDATKATPVLFVVLYKDAGQVGKHEIPGPDVPQEANGEKIQKTFNSSGVAASASSTPMAMAMETPSAGGPTPQIKVSDQSLTGDAVMVDDVISVGPGWIVIYTVDASGQPNQPIGHAAVKDGDNQMVMVQVDPAKAQGTLVAQLHTDKGAIGTFEFPGDDAPIMMGVQMIASTFKITNGQASEQATASGPATPAGLQPSIEVSDQAIKDGTVTIPQVVSNGNWWLVIHKQNPNGSMGEYVGATQIKNGINTNVVVKIDTKEATPVLYAMLHEDHGAIGSLEFPGPDIPVMVNGQMITPQFNVTGLVEDVAIKIRTLSNSVSFLTDDQGDSLYFSLKDAPGKNNCTGACLDTWKPLLVSGKLIPDNGVAQANLGVLLLPDGSRQATYKGVPLYTYAKDANPGDTSGQGIDGIWFLMTP